jgi:hypothetical protein
VKLWPDPRAWWHWPTADTAPPAAPQTVTDTLERLEAEAAAALPCDYGWPVHDAHGAVVSYRECDHPAEWIVYWREWCAGGAAVDDPEPGLMCNPHLEWYMSVCDDRMTATCHGCGRRVTGAGHLIERAEAINGRGA